MDIHKNILKHKKLQYTSVVFLNPDQSFMFTFWVSHFGKFNKPDSAKEYILYSNKLFPAESGVQE